ncbi:MAG: type II toxin-antitoxin system HicA family toxin [Bryobacteraceae bacterium]
MVIKLKACRFQFDRHAAGSHEIWFNAGTLRAILKQAGIGPDEFLKS